jgi:hypothetical protein
MGKALVRKEKGTENLLIGQKTDEGDYVVVVPKGSTPGKFLYFGVEYTLSQIVLGHIFT